MTTSDLLNAWREATRAADLAERLAKVASDTAERADLNAEAAEEVAGMAERAAASAIAAAERARRAADDARRIAQESRQENLRDADSAHTATRRIELEARDAYHQAEDSARARHQSDRE